MRTTTHKGAISCKTVTNENPHDVVFLPSFKRSALGPGARADNGLSLSRTARDGSFDGDASAGLDEYRPGANGAAEAIEAAGDHVVVVQERQRLVPGPELGDGDVRVDAVGGGDDTLIVVVGVDPHAALDGELAVDGRALGFDGGVARLRHGDRFKSDLC